MGTTDGHELITESGDSRASADSLPHARFSEKPDGDDIQQGALAPAPFQVLKENLYYPLIKVTVRFIDENIGLGVFATDNIHQGELIERCPLIQLDWRRKYHGDSQLHRYLYTNSGCRCRDCDLHGAHMYMVVGYGMLYNHHDSPNTKWTFNFKQLYADLVAVKAIETGKQILVSYGDKYFTNRKKLVIDE